jgi:hypothetical protein
MAKKLFDNAAFELADLKNAEEDQKEEKEEKEKEKEKEQDKNGYYECFFEYEVNASGIVTGSSYFRDAFNAFPVSDYRTEVFSPPEVAVI